MSLEYMQGIQDQLVKNEVIKQLRSALASEFMITHNYGIQAAIVQGHNKEEIKKFLLEAQESERQHCKLIIDRIMELGGSPDIRPLNWDKLSPCNYQTTTSVDQRLILDEAYEMESCISESYVRLLQFLEPRDRTSYDLINRILEEEYTGIESLKKLQENLLSTSERNSNE